MFDQTWKWAGRARRSDKNIGVRWHEIPVHLNQMLGDVRVQIEHKAFPPAEIAARYIAALRAADGGDCQPLLDFLQ